MDPAQLQPGYRLDRYELLCPLAYGGMASVWLARFGGRLGFERLVVVKMILPQYSQDPRFQEMFLDEATIASKIEHTNVARILDIGEHDENYFIVMEWVDGDSLSKIVRAAEARKSRVPPGVALRICADAAAGLHAAHTLRDRDGTSLGVVHRDVSPQNILVSNAGATVLIDFGVAKARDRVAQETSAGQLKGKIRYMAPEQALGTEVDHRADVWSLGAILYELFSGTSPYEGANEVATLHKLTSGAAPGPLPSSTPAAVATVIERALAYDRDARFATMQDFAFALESAMVELGEPTSMAQVARYTGQLLAERKAARKKAVDAALEAAKARDGMRASTTKSFPPMAAPLAQQRATLPLAAAFDFSSAGVSPGTIPPPPSSEVEHFGLAELPSATSSATLGSAAVEFPPATSSFAADLAARRRRVFAAASLGVSLAAGVVGAVLIVSTAIVRHGESARGGASAQAPPESAEVAPPPSARATAAEPPPSASPAMPSQPSPPSPAETVAASAAAPAATAGTTTTATTTAAAEAATTSSATPSRAPTAPPATTAHPTPPRPAAPPPKAAPVRAAPPPPPPPKKDYGF